MPANSNKTHSNRKCRTCKYRAYEYSVNGCDYTLITGHSRGCSVKDCDRYEKGPKIKIKKEITIVRRE